MRDRYLTQGQRLVGKGIRASQLVIDLDETLWEWAAPVLRQPTLLWSHREYVYVRRPLLWLLEGIVKHSNERLCAWTSGYGYRLDRVSEQIDSLAEMLQYDPSVGQQSETLPNVFTRMDLARALEAQPALIPKDEGKLVSQKIPHTPTAAGKPMVDSARVLLDDKERNCQRFVDAGDNRSALWLKGTPRLARKTLPVFSIPDIGNRLWADGVVDALEQIAEGQSGLFKIESVESNHVNEAVCVHLPHLKLWREWLAPSKRIRQAQERL